MASDLLKQALDEMLKAAMSSKGSMGSQSGIEPGIRVVRGPDWKWQNQDGGPGNLGTVTKVEPGGTSHIIWDNGGQNTYRTGAEGGHDLRVFDNAPIGVRHDSVTCDVCSENGVTGLRWQCCSCHDYDLCSRCYMTDKHDTHHEFLRYDIPNCSSGVKVSPRATSQKIIALGAFAKAKVTRGPDWKWGDQDGGHGKVGEVLEVKNWGDNSVRSAVRVKWGTDKTDNYRMGHQGKVDLKCVKLTEGATYYPEHLPSLGQAIAVTGFKVGDKVKTELDADILRAMQEGHGGWNPEMSQIIGKVGTICRAGSDVLVKFEGFKTQLRLNPEALVKVGSGFEPGDMVTISEDAAYVENQQDGHGGWNDEMRQSLGKLGQVTRIYGDGDIRVKVDGKTWCLNPSCCTFISKGEPPSQSDDPMDDAQSGLLDLLKMLGGQVKEKESLVKVTAQGKLKDILEILKKDPSKVNDTEQDKTALQVACHQGYGEIVEELLRHNAKLDIPDSDGDYPIHFCAFGNRPEIIDILMDNSADINLLNFRSLTALHLSVHKQHTSCVKSLLSHGADPNTQDVAGDTPLHDAIREDHAGIISQLVKEPSIDFTIHNEGGFNLLQHAAIKGNVRAVTQILERNPQMVNIAKADGFTALHLAAVNDHGDIVEILAGQDGVDLEVKNNQGHTPLILGLIREYTSVIESLVSHGANVQAHDGDGDTCLHFALLKGPEKRTVSDTSETGKILKRLKVEKAEYGIRLGTACYLIDHGADINVINKSGRTPLDNVRDSTAREIIHNYTKNRLVREDGACALPGNILVEEDAAPPGNIPVEAEVDCIICSDNTADVKFEPCGHRIICRECCGRMKNCLQCQQAIREKVFIDKETDTGSGVSDALFSRGDLVMVELDADVMQVMQEGIGNWDPRMSQCIKKTGTVEEVIEAVGVKVKFNGFDSWILHPVVLVKMAGFSTGDTVKISTNKQLVKESQQGHGDWHDKMEKALGKDAIVVNVLPSRDLIISVDNQTWAMNPACCTLVSKRVGDDMPAKHAKTQYLGENLFRPKIKDDQSVTEMDLVQKAGDGKLQEVIRIVEMNPHQIDKKSSGKTALQVSSHQGHTEVVIYLLGRGADVDAKDDDKDTPLHHAAYGNRPEILQMLIHKGSSVNSTNKKGATALHVAINKHSRRCAQVLLSHAGCDVNIQDSCGDVPLHDALKADISLVDIMLARDDVNYTLTNKKGFNILHQAAIAGHVKCTKRAIEKAPEIVNAKKDDGFTALHLSTYNNHVDVSEALIKQGKASINVRNDNYATPLLLAASESYTAVIELLVDNGADVKALDEEGNSCLHLVLANMKEPEEPKEGSHVAKMKLTLGSRVKQYQVRAALACYLVEHGADIHPKNDKKLTPMEVLRYPVLADVIKEQHSKQKRSSPADMDQSSQCMVCHDARSDVTLKPCGHRVVCKTCCQRLKKCLKCQAIIQNKVIDGAPPVVQPHTGAATGGGTDEIEEMRNKMAQLEGNYICSICQDFPRNVVFLCGHSTCQQCSQALSVCHICRQPITQRINVFA